MTLSHLFLGFSSGLIVGLAVACHAISRAVVMGLIAGIVIGGIVIDGVEGYLRWPAYLPDEMRKFTGFWIAMSAGFLGGAVVAWAARTPTRR